MNFLHNLFDNSTRKSIICHKVNSTSMHDYWLETIKAIHSDKGGVNSPRRRSQQKLQVRSSPILSHHKRKFIKVAYSHKVFLRWFHPQKRTKSISFQPKLKSWGKWFGTFFWEWDKIENEIKAPLIIIKYWYTFLAL